MEADNSERVTKFNKFTDEMRQNSCCEFDICWTFLYSKLDADEVMEILWTSSATIHDVWGWALTIRLDLVYPNRKCRHTYIVDQATKNDLKGKPKTWSNCGRISDSSNVTDDCEMWIIYGSTHTWRETITIWLCCYLSIFSLKLCIQMIDNFLIRKWIFSLGGISLQESSFLVLVWCWPVLRRAEEARTLWVKLLSA